MAGVDPFLMRLFVFAGANEVFHLHLFELAGAKNEIARGYFVAKRFADLRHAERKFAPAGIEHVKKVYEDALRGFWTKIDECVLVVFRSSADVRAKHEVERPRFR